MCKLFEFAVVPDLILPYCFLLGLDFLTEHNIDLDFYSNSCKIDFNAIERLIPTVGSSSSCVLVTQAEEPAVKSNVFGADGWQIVVEDDCNVISGLSLLFDNAAIQHVQLRYPDLRSLHIHMSRGIIDIIMI